MDDRIVDDSVVGDGIVDGGAPRESAGKIVGMEALLDWVRDTRARGETIAFANGCFDILHVGHVRYLRASAEEADRLIVALNDDKSVEQLKALAARFFRRPRAPSSSPRSSPSIA